MWFSTRILESNLREIKLYSDNLVFYNQQLSALKFYKFFRNIMLTAILSMIAAIAVHLIGNIVVLSLDGFSVLPYFHYKCFKQVSNYQIQVLHTCFIHAQRILGLIYGCLLSLSLFGITLGPVIQQCIRRFRDHEDLYRFNYDNLKSPFIKR